MKKLSQLVACGFFFVIGLYAGANYTAYTMESGLSHAEIEAVILEYELGKIICLDMNGDFTCNRTKADADNG